MQNNVTAFFILTAEELILFALLNSDSEYIIRSSGLFLIQQYNGDLIDMSVFIMPFNDVELIRVYNIYKIYINW